MSRIHPSRLRVKRHGAKVSLRFAEEGRRRVAVLESPESIA